MPARLRLSLHQTTHMAHILITNDDGIQAEGLRALVQAVEGLGTISVVAPSHERSASAQSLTPVSYTHLTLPTILRV